MRDLPDQLVYIKNIKDNIDILQTYTSNHSFEQFQKSEWDQAAIIRHLEIIGEASGRIGHDYQAMHPDIPWRKLKNLRNILIHDYADVDINIVWNIIIHDIPDLKRQIEKCL